MKVIIPQAPHKQQESDWQIELRGMITDPQELLAQLGIASNDIEFEWNSEFPLRVTQSFVARMKAGDPTDPLLKQVLAHPRESQPTIFHDTDPLKEVEVNPLPGLLHKFTNRVLLTFTTSCAIHCRYCFRRHFPYEKNNPGRKGWHQALDYIAQRPEIIEVILSGGDPLMAQDDMIAEFLQQLEQIEHVELLRIHTRLPVVAPSRIQPNLIQILQNTRLITTMIYHINHAQELNPDIQAGAMALKQAGITVLNQSVLLAGVNDDVLVLKDLSLALHKHGILPYYVNLLDSVKGTEHFDVSHSQARQLQDALRLQLPGYLLPRFVRELPGVGSKVPLENLPD